MIGQPRYREVKVALQEGIESLKKWYHRVDGTSSAYFICLGKSISNFQLVMLPWLILTIHPVLDPNVKDLYCHHCWEQEQYDAGMRRLEAVVSRTGI